MIRRAIIIWAPGPVGASNFLPGVEKDFRNYQTFLRSASGGAWQEEEITLLPNPTRVGLLAQLRNTRADYVLLIFSGHGGMDPNTYSDYLRINDAEEKVKVSELKTGAARELVLLDSCRTFSSSLASLVAEDLRQIPATLSPAEAREEYDDHLKMSESGRVICYACADGTGAADTPGGGLFSATLLDSAQEWLSQPGSHPVLSIKGAFDITYSKINAMDTEQSPRVTTIPYLRNIWFPFAVRKSRQLV